MPKTLATDTVPINKLNLRSIFVVPEMNATVSSGEQIQCQGIAFDAGSGIKQVDVSTDGGNTFKPATLVGPDLGNYSWRQWRFDWRPDSIGQHTLAVRATSNSGAVQTNIPQWNRSGYMRNVIEKVEVNVV